MADYYTRRRTDGVYTELFGPFASYDEAMADHAGTLGGGGNPGRMQTLIDIATIGGNVQQMGELLLRDPALFWVFSLGRRAGKLEARYGQPEPKDLPGFTAGVTQSHGPV